VIDGNKIGESHWAAEAAECANEQSKFWEYHDKLFAVWRGENVGTYTKANLKKYAADLQNLDTATFDQCVDSDKYASLVQDHMTEALQLGLPGTPSFLLDGRVIPIQSLDFSEFVRFIEPELK
jgi:protein-disulfide isomerase